MAATLAAEGSSICQHNRCASISANLRALMLAGGSSTYRIGLDLVALLLATAALVLADGWLYPNVVQ